MSHSHAANRREDLRLITGRGRYTADTNLPGQLYAAFVRADRAHAKIVSIDAQPALARPGVVGVFTGADAVAAQYTQFPNLMTFTGKSGKQYVAITAGGASALDDPAPEGSEELMVFGLDR